MADEDQGKDKPSLELPSLGFGRRRGKKGVPPAEPAAPPPDEEAIEVIDRPTPDAEPTPGRPLFVDEAEPTHGAPPAPAPVGSGDEAAAAAGRRRPGRRSRLPAISGMVAAVVTGALVGALTVGLTWIALRGCEAIKGTSSCGGPGLFLLVAIMIAMILLGSALLRSWGVPDPGSTSFLAVGLMAVMALLFLVELLFNWWMIIVIPVIAMLTFALSHWVTTAFIEPTN